MNNVIYIKNLKFYYFEKCNYFYLYKKKKKLIFFVFILLFNFYIYCKKIAKQNIL